LSIISGNLQVWHQLLTRLCRHSVVANEARFFLALREKDKTLQISSAYSFSGEEATPAGLRRSLSILSFFIAHSIYSSHLNNSRFSGAETPRIGSSIPLSNPGEEMARFEPVDGRPSHHRSNSNSTTTGGMARRIDSLKLLLGPLKVRTSIPLCCSLVCSAACPYRLS
jgi:hypothetical protein